MTKTKTRLISACVAALVLAAALFLILPTVLSTTAGGEAWDGTAATEFAGGTGTEMDPYLISTAEQLAYLSESVCNGDNYSGKYIKLTADIVLNESLDGTPRSWTPIGKFGNSFGGTFDGNGKTIKGVYINKPDDGLQLGLFGELNLGTIKNVGVINSSVKGLTFVGGVCGKNDSGTIINCYYTGTVSGTTCVGGICGIYTSENSSNTSITNCFNTGDVTGEGTGNSCVGGICGNFNSGAKITACYSTGSVSGESYVGGVCGYNGGAATTITDCYYLEGKASAAVGSFADTSDVRSISAADLCDSIPRLGAGRLGYSA